MSNNAELLKPHQIMAQDEYWAGPVTSLANLTAEAGIVLDDHDSDPIHMIDALFKKARSTGFIARPVEDGQRLPAIHPHQPVILRVVHETRQERRLSTAGHIAAVLFNPERVVFNALAITMDNDTLYSGGPVGYVLPRQTDSRTVKIQKGVSYLHRLNASDYAGLSMPRWSRALGSMDEIFMPSLQVGEIYEGDQGDKLRVSSAQLIRPYQTGQTRIRRPRLNELNDNIGSIASV